MGTESIEYNGETYVPIGVPNFEKHYYISESGSLLTTRWWGEDRKKLLTKTRKPNGNIYYSLRRRGTKKPCLVLAHRIVARTFLEDKSQFGLVIAFKNGDKSDISASNLEWVSKSKVHLDSLYRKASAGKPLMRMRPIERLDPKTGEVLDTYLSLEQAARQGGYVASAVRRCCIGAMKLHHGFRWRYAD